MKIGRVGGRRGVGGGDTRGGIAATLFGKKKREEVKATNRGRDERIKITNA